MTRAHLMAGQRYTFDDTRADLLALDDITGNPVEIRFYFAMDTATRRIVAWTWSKTGVNQPASVNAKQVIRLVARTLRSGGIAPAGAGWYTTLKFERGMVACAPAVETALRTISDGRIHVSKTAMDGGKAHAAAPRQAGSGHWMGKAEIESFMRTFAFMCQGIPGQRGGDFRRQPAQLGLTGRNRKTGFLAFTPDSLGQRAALHAYGDRALALVEGRLAGELAATPPNMRWEGSRVRINSMLTVSQAIVAMTECIAWYHQRTDHRHEGFAQVQYFDEHGVPKNRMESIEERHAALVAQCEPEAISEADAALLMMEGGFKPVTVTPQGVRMSIGPYKRVRFWREGSVACAMAARLATLKREMVALVDEEAFLSWSPNCPQPREIYLFGDSPDSPDTWQPGHRGRFLESLPLAEIGEVDDPVSLAEQTAAKERVVRSHYAELVRMVAPHLAKDLATAIENEARVKPAIALVRTAREGTPSAAAQAVAAARSREATPPGEEPPPVTRRAGKVAALTQLLASLADDDLEDASA